MLDFLRVSTRSPKQGAVEIYPKFVIGHKSSDLMIRGGDFYAIWDEERGIWSTDEDDAIRLVDRELQLVKNEKFAEYEGTVRVLYLWDSDSGSIDRWHKYCQKQCRDSYHTLDETILFANTPMTKTDYASKQLSYPLERGSITAYDKLMSTLYTEAERHKIEWAIGAIVTGDSKTIQKFIVLYGSPGGGKGTVLNIIEQLFAGYCAVFDAKALGSSSNQFALEAFRANPLVAIQHDGDLSRIEDNTRINSLVSHESMTVNEKYKSTYTNRFKAFLFMGTNKPVKITDGKSGLIRRLIDVSPSGKTLSTKEYNAAVAQVKFELGAIAYHCKEVYLENPSAYDNYIPINMLGASNDFYNYICEAYHIFLKADGTSLKAAWEMYKIYCEEAKVPYPMTRRQFQEELKNYFWKFESRAVLDDGSRPRCYYSGFRTDKFAAPEEIEDKTPVETWLELTEQSSIFDREYADCPAQYASEQETPVRAWDDVETKLSDLDTSQLHYVRVPENHIVIDFDLKNEKGEKSYACNVAAASGWPATYAEVSKSGAGIHLHYIYAGDVSRLSRVYGDDIEVKIFTGKSSLRRKLTKCNNLPVAEISSGLPMKGEKPMINKDVVQTEKGLRTTIKKCLNKEVHPNTRCNMDFIKKILDDAYESGLHYDVSDMENAIFAFAANATNQSDYCIKLMDKIHFKSDEAAEAVNMNDAPIVFFDIEIFPNLFLVNWKFAGEDKPVVRMINPKPHEVEELMKYRLIGFNCRRYDNHILYAALLGYSTRQLYELSQKIVKTPKGENNRYLFREAYNISYTDVYDFASAGNKKSLKKLEIEMGIHHQELGLPWDESVPEALWPKVAEYCDNDVIATEAAFHYLRGDWTTRKILADISGLTVNDTTNTQSTRTIFGTNREPQSEFNYRDLSKPVGADQYAEYVQKFGEDYRFRVFDAEGLPLYRDYIPEQELPEGWSILPFFPGYKHEGGVSTYLGEKIGEGGKVYAEPGIHTFVWDGDVTGQHPSSIIAERLFGPRYTKIFEQIVNARVSIKHQDWDAVEDLFDGKLKPYIQQVKDGELTSKELANALKTVVNSVYGLTKASFKNPFRDNRNKDNIVAKRGALFMTLLKREVQKRGFTVAHIKTDSIKIPNATQEIKDFVIEFGKEFGYSFETEAEFEKFCLVNDAVYIAKTKDGEWTATGKQFAVPYVFKKLFSHEDIVFDDMCETIAVTQGELYLDMNESLPDVSREEKEFDKLCKRRSEVSPDGGEEARYNELSLRIVAGHDYHFVGRVGRFCPVQSGHGGGTLYRKCDGKYYAASGTKGYRWLESETVRAAGMEDAIDRSYYNRLVDDAVEAIAKYGDFEWFVSDVVEPKDWPEDDEYLPF